MGHNLRNPLDELTHQATLRDWRFKMTVFDIVWAAFSRAAASRGVSVVSRAA